MSKEITNTILLTTLFLLLFIIAEMLYHKAKMKADDTRKIVHTGSGFICMLFPIMLHSHWYVLLLCASFLAGLFISKKYHFLRSVNGIDRVSYGSLWYPVAVYGCYLAYVFFQHNLLFFYLSVLTMAVCDPMAAFFGKQFPYGKYYIGGSAKTATGSAAFFLFSVVLTFIVFHFFSTTGFSARLVLPAALLIAAVATLAEALSAKGLDNITIPASVVFVLYFVV